MKETPKSTSKYIRYSKFLNATKVCLQSSCIVQVHVKENVSNYFNECAVVISYTVLHSGENTTTKERNFTVVMRTTK